VDMQKTLVAARVQLRQIMGDDNFRVYMRHVRHSLAFDTRRGLRGRGPGRGMMDGGPTNGGMMDGRGLDGAPDVTQGS
jgi:hypothetical protein